jgi:hypothetical protein
VGDPRRAWEISTPSLLGGINAQLAGVAEMSEGDFKLELENASLRRLLEHAATDAARRDSAEALELAGVEFIDENGGGPGVRLRRR